VESFAFPSDRYAFDSQIRFHGYDPATTLIEIKPREGEHTIRTEDIEKVINEDGKTIALILFSGVQFFTGQYFEMERITRTGHEYGCLVGFDLAHAAGNVDVKLHDWDVDFACWCSYKYLNSGPGGIAGVFVHDRFADDKSFVRFEGWWSHNPDVRFNGTNDLLPGAASFQVSNPPIFQMAALLSSLAIFDEAGMSKLRAKSKLLTAYLEHLLKTQLNSDIEIITPSDPEQRGAQLSLRFKKFSAKQIKDTLSELGILCDEREPDVIRVAPTPLYNTFEEIYNFVAVLKKVISS